MKKKKNGMFLELEGTVRIIEKKNGKVVSSEDLDGKVVLECVNIIIRDALKEH
jgi:hypothetical protein